MGEKEVDTRRFYEICDEIADRLGIPRMPRPEVKEADRDG